MLYIVQAAMMAKFLAHDRHKFPLDQLDVTLIKGRTGESGVHVNPYPVGPVGGDGVLSVELDQSGSEGLRSIFEKFDPFRIPTALKYRLVHAFNQCLLARKITIQQGLGNSQTFGKLAGLTRKAHFCKVGDGSINDLSFPLRRREPRFDDFCRQGFCRRSGGLSHIPKDRVAYSPLMLLSATSLLYLAFSAAMKARNSSWVLA